MSSPYCQPCSERIEFGRKRAKGERCQVPSCPNYALDHRSRRKKLKGMKGITGS